MKQSRHVVIMAGGKGERFWPLSRLKRPKHLLPIVGDKPMLAQTVERLEGLVSAENVLVITNAEQVEATREACPMLKPEQIVGEPVGRDTAAAVGLAAILVKRRAPDAAFAMLPADHAIHDEAGFRAVLEAAFHAAESEQAILTIGIKPDTPATGYGYIHRGEETLKAEGRSVFEVKSFKEKPDLQTAESYLASGEYFWNGGIFVWTSQTICGELERQTPGLWAALQEIDSGLSAGQPLDKLLEEHYPGLQKISIDYAVMENAQRVLTIQSDFDWDDVGAWPAVARHTKADDNGNAVRGLAALKDARDCLVVSEEGKTVALLGVEGLIVVQTDDATLVCPKDKAQEVKALVKSIGERDELSGLL